MEGAGLSTGETTEVANAYMSRFGQVTRVMESTGWLILNKYALCLQDKLALYSQFLNLRESNSVIDYLGKGQFLCVWLIYLQLIKT